MGFQCIICLDMCHECINCQKCHQILCRRHVQHLSENCCPSCRDTPFRFQENIPLQRIIREVRERTGIPEPPSEESDAEESVAAPVPEPEPVIFAPDARFGSKVPCRGPGREGQFQKIPTETHEASLTAHVRCCRHPGCRSVWRGPWGKFIGGADGSTHFDLTDCAEGMRLNRMTGWDYDDPRS